MALAIESGIPVSQWWEEDERDLETALDILAEARRRDRRHRDDDDDARGVVTSD